MTTTLKSSSIKHVTFASTLSIFEFPIIIGDNPAVSAGCPITMARKHQFIEEKNFEIHEDTKQKKQRNQNQKKNKRSSSNNNNSSKRLLIPVEKRSQLLLKSGHSMRDIAMAILKVETIKEERLETLRKSGWENFIHESGKLPKGLIKAALGTTNDWISSGAGLLSKQLNKAFGGSNPTSTNSKPKTLQARSA